MKQIIHLSDLHIGFQDLEDRFQDLVENLIAEMKPAADYVVVITGDLVEKPAGTNQYQRARRVLDRLNGAGFTTLVVPGNHDYNNGLVLSETFVPQFKETFFGDPHLTYPKLDIIDGIAFIGLDSMAEELHWYDQMFAEGELGRAQLQRLDDLLGDASVQRCAHRVIYLHHHPFDPMPLGQLKDSRKLKRVIRRHNNVDALLFGHNHLGRERHGRWGVPRCYDGGTATGKKPGRIHHRVFDLSQDPASDEEKAFLA
jgi:3',5'-cyclic AMP phosphodiesterase CpdA